MSELNGDKARFQRLRKAKMRRHQRTRELWAAVRGGTTRMHHAKAREQSGRVQGPAVIPRPRAAGSVAE